MKRLRFVVAVAIVLIAGSASAATITETYDVHASDFSGPYGPYPAGTPTFTGSIEDFHAIYTVTFDPGLVSGATTQGLEIDLLSFPSSGVTKFAHSNDFPYDRYSLNFGTDVFVDGAGVDGPGGYVVGIVDVAGSLSADVIYDDPTGIGIVGSGIATVLAVSAAPEPGSWSLMIFAVAIVGNVLRQASFGAIRRRV